MTALAFTSKRSKEFIGDSYWVPATEAEQSNFGTMWPESRGRELLTQKKNIGSAERVERIETNPEEAPEGSIWA